MISFLNWTAPVSEQLGLIFGILFLVILLVALWQGVSLTVYKKLNQKISFDLLRSKLLLESTEGVWCAWGDVYGKSLSFFHSKYFCKLFNMNLGSLFELGPVFDLLQDDSSKKLQTKISLLHAEQIPFQMEIMMIDFKKMFVKGYHFNEDGLSLNVIWFREADLLLEEEQPNLIRESFKLKNLMDVLPFPTWMRDEKFRITYVNKAYAQLLDKPLDKVVQESMEVPSWIDKEDPYKFPREVFQSSSSHKKRFYTIIKGGRHLMEVCEFPEKYVGVHGGYAVDLTQQEELRESFERYKQVEKNVLDSLLNTAVAIFGPDMRIKTYNQAYLNIRKLDENWVQKNPTMGEILDELRQRRQLPDFADYKEYKEQRINLFHSLTGHVEEIQHQPDGKILRLVQAPHPLGGLILTVEDVTSYLRLESDLRVMLSVYRETIDHLYEGVLLFGTDNRIVLSNPALGLLWGLGDKSRETGRHLSHLIEEIKDFLIVPRDWEEYKSHILDNMSDRIPKVRQLYLKNQKIYQLSYIPLPDGSNLLIFLDVTGKDQEYSDISTLTTSVQETV